jgi:hypothetical protein
MNRQQTATVFITTKDDTNSLINDTTKLNRAAAPFARAGPAMEARPEPK